MMYLAVEISWGSSWVNLNDGEKYQINGDQTRDSVSVSHRKVVAESPVLGGNYLVHAVPNMIEEQVSVWVNGQDQVDLSENFVALGELFEQYDYRMRWTFENYRETWRCQLAESTYSRGRVWTHNLMALSNFQVPRYPEVVRERI